MKSVEHWVLRIADSNATWRGFGWLRPKKHQRVGYGYIIFSSILLGLPGVAVGASLIYLFFGRVEPTVCLSLFMFALFVELLLHGLFAHFWNRRAEILGRNQSST